MTFQVQPAGPEKAQTSSPQPHMHKDRSSPKLLFHAGLVRREQHPVLHGKVAILKSQAASLYNASKGNLFSCTVMNTHLLFAFILISMSPPSSLPVKSPKMHSVMFADTS